MPSRKASANVIATNRQKSQGAPWSRVCNASGGSRCNPTVYMCYATNARFGTAEARSLRSFRGLDLATSCKNSETSPLRACLPHRTASGTMARYILERGWDQQPWLSARSLPHLLQRMLGKLLLVNVGELELETFSMMITRLENNVSQ